MRVCDKIFTHPFLKRGVKRMKGCDKMKKNDKEWKPIALVVVIALVVSIAVFAVGNGITGNAVSGEKTIRVVEGQSYGGINTEGLYLDKIHIENIVPSGSDRGIGIILVNEVNEDVEVFVKYKRFFNGGKDFQFKNGLVINVKTTAAYTEDGIRRGKIVVSLVKEPTIGQNIDGIEGSQFIYSPYEKISLRVDTSVSDLNPATRGDGWNIQYFTYDTYGNRLEEYIDRELYNGVYDGLSNHWIVDYYAPSIPGNYWTEITLYCSRDDADCSELEYSEDKEILEFEVREGESSGEVTYQGVLDMLENNCRVVNPAGEGLGDLTTGKAVCHNYNQLYQKSTRCIFSEVVKGVSPSIITESLSCDLQIDTTRWANVMCCSTT